MRILWDSNLYKSIILSHLNRWFCLAPGFRTRFHGPVVKLLPVVSGGPRIEDLILRSRISPAIGGLEADEKKTETQRRGGVEPSDLFT